MKALIKIGGTLLDSAESRARLAAEIGAAVASGLRAVIVHGGGKQMTRYLAERGVESQFVNGLRVTTPEILDAVLKIFAGSVNQELVAAFVACGVRAVGLTGMDAMLTEARQMNADLGLVGKPVRSDARLPDLLLDNAYLPVVACVAGDAQGRFYNVNADHMAVSIAAAIQAEKLLFLTDVEGVRGHNNALLSGITLAETRSLVADRIATGGMQAKLEAAAEALRLGVSEVTIAPGATTGVISKVLSGERIGTKLAIEVGVSKHG